MIEIKLKVRFNFFLLNDLTLPFESIENSFKDKITSQEILFQKDHLKDEFYLPKYLFGAFSFYNIF